MTEVPSALDAAFEEQRSRFVVGIDLGTTNCAVAFVDTQKPSAHVEIFRIEQLVDFQTRQKNETLPSFHYEVSESERQNLDPRHAFRNANHVAIVGHLARQRSIQVSGRAISSAKSWLCHGMVNRTSDLLPWNGDDDVQRLSPVEVSRRYLEHIRRMWDHEHPNAPLAQQETIITLPASFDEVARQLTVQSARDAGYGKVILIEEPQAAFYAWLERNQQNWTNTLTAGQTILVCDIGGGTTDFTLIRVVESESKANTAPSTVASNPDLSQSVNVALEKTYGLHRVAVGEHLMLGGDNLDLALAKSLEQQIIAQTAGHESLKPRQWDALKSQSRVAKETLLGSHPPEQFTISLPGAGSRLIESTRAVNIERTWAKKLLVDGFFGKVSLQDRPNNEGEGFQEFGLPYASEPNVNKHLAAFLWDHRWDGRSDSDRETLDDLNAAKPDWILFNGGVLESTQIRDAIVDQVADWFCNAKQNNPSETTPWKPGILDGNRLDLAVAQGAAYFGLVRRGVGVKIDARLARSYYMVVDTDPPRAMCVMPGSASPQDRFRIDQHPFNLTLGQPVQFPLLYSSTNLVHSVGDIVAVDPLSMTELPPIQTVIELPNQKRKGEIPVVVETELTEIGTLKIQMVSLTDASEETTTNPAPESKASSAANAVRWNLEFDVRSTASLSDSKASTTDTVASVVDSNSVERVIEVLDSVFGKSPTTPVRDCLQELSRVTGESRRDWKPSLLREIWRFLIENQEGRKLSVEHESRWINLLGWSLRPGFGMPADDWRVNQSWKSVHNKLLHRYPLVVSETIVLWRRIAGGFTPGQQNALFQDCWNQLRPTLAPNNASAQNQNANVVTELLRLTGSLEWLKMHDKVMVAEAAIKAIGRKKLEPLHPSLLWMIGRIGARMLVYADLQQVVSSQRITAWIEQLLAKDIEWCAKMGNSYSLCLMQLARKTGDRYREIPQPLRERILAQLLQLNAPSLHVQLISEVGKLAEEDETTIVGDSLPLGFSLRRN